MDNQSGTDYLSDLPLDIIHIILAFVPIRDAVKTSILSSQWRYIWATLPQLVFDDEDQDSAYNDEDHLKNCINQALKHHKGPIHKLKFAITSLIICPDIDQWLLCLSKNDIRELCLIFVDFTLKVPSSVYYFQNLTHLELFGCKLPPLPPTFKGFKCLRWLVISLLSPSNAIETLVASSPLLEHLKLNDEHGKSVFRISAPNLKHITLRSVRKEICLYAPLLVNMCLEYDFFGLEDEDDFTAEHQPLEDSVCTYTNLLASCTNLESLHVWNFTKFLSIGIEAYHNSLVFHHLKVIGLYTLCFLDIKEISIVARLIMGAPNLRKLKVHDCVFQGSMASEAPRVSVRDFGFTPDFTFEKLKVFSIRMFWGVPLQMELIKFVLKSSPVLDRMEIGYLSTHETKEKLLNMMTESLGYHRASPNAEVLFKRLIA